MTLIAPNKLGGSASAVYSTTHIGLGSNLENPLWQVSQALRELSQLPGTVQQRVSSFYETAPIGWLDQSSFINAVVCLQTNLSPHDLLGHLRTIEARHQRTRSVKNGPRTLDLDILTFSDWQIDDPDLTIPHPRLCERAFVLVPLLEISPTILIPGKGYARIFLKNVKAQRVHKLSASASQAEGG